jgi:hypothetical protein
VSGTRSIGIDTHRQRAALIGGLGAFLALLKFAAAASAAGMIWIHLCGSWTPGSGGTGGALGVAYSGASNPGVSTPYQCPGPGSAANGMEVFGGGSNVPAGGRAYWQINAPSGLAIVGVHTEGSGMISYGVDSGMGWGGGFYWQGGGAQTYQGQIGYSSPPLFSSYFGWQIICGWSTCNGVNKPGEISILGLELEAAEGSGPTVSVTPGSLGAAGGWVRGSWPISFSADGPTGACQLSASLGGASVSQPLNEPQSQVTWHQCPAASFSQSVNTAAVGSGASVPLVMWARDAGYDYSAGQYLSNTITRYVNIDNAPVGVSLSGPSDAPSTAGTQYVTATGSAGPSGVSGIGCSADGAPYQWYPKATVQVPVAGVGVHRVTCYSANNARDASGNVATSAPQSWTLSVREPTVSGIGFGKLVDALLCRRITKRVKVPAHWVTVRHHHRRVRVRRRARTKLERVTRCHPRIVRRRITVWKTVIRHGKKVRVKRHKTIKVVQLPHVVMHSSKRVRHGKRTIVSGWVGMPDGTALGGQAVQVLTAPDNGLGHFAPAAVVTTAANGSWSAQLPVGPSRLVEAYYAGAPTLEPSVSAQVHVIVPAKVKLLSVSPRRVAWGGTVHITGQLVGGYLPPGGALVRLRIGQGSSYQTYGVQEHVTGSGRFTTTYQFGAGDPAAHRSFWFQIATLPMGDYPYAPAASGRRSVLVGGHPPPAVGAH